MPIRTAAIRIANTVARRAGRRVQVQRGSWEIGIAAVGCRRNTGTSDGEVKIALRKPTYCGHTAPYQQCASENIETDATVGHTSERDTGRDVKRQCGASSRPIAASLAPKSFFTQLPGRIHGILTVERN